MCNLSIFFREDAGARGDLVAHRPGQGPGHTGHQQQLHRGAQSAQP